MTCHKDRTETGQTLVIFTIAIIALTAILALALDGGIAYSNRRKVQNAADAGALAGARVYCLTEDITQATWDARDYAITKNGAEQATVTFDTENKIVTVNATISSATSFAHLLGFDAMTANAEAAAGCVSPSLGEGTLPVAWSCRPPLGGSDSSDCEEDWLTYDELQFRLDPANSPPDGDPIWDELYILMDSNSVGFDIYCYDADTNPTGVNCDLDGDGDDDVITGGDRSWLDLDGYCGGACLQNWLEEGFNGSVQVHYWLPGQAGVNNAVFQSAATREGDIVSVPIFDQYCDQNPTNCDGVEIHAQDEIIGPSNGSDYFHIIGFAAFYISCVDAPGVTGHSGCPGHDWAVDLDVIDHNDKTIEGYFVTGFIPGLSGGGSSGGGVDTGAYVLLLTK